MKALIIYDSNSPNTKKLAYAIGAGFDHSKIVLTDIENLKFDQLNDINNLIVGAPSHGLQPARNLISILSKIPPKGLMNTYVTAFDTRPDLRNIHSRFLRFIINPGGFAAEKIEKLLIKKGGILVLPHKGFYVNRRFGAGQKGELLRAFNWGKEIEELSLI
jgi:flavodoxin